MKVPTIVVSTEVLSSWLTIAEYTKSRLAAELGVSRGRVSQLLTSDEEPSAHLMAKLLTLTHLPFERLFTVVREPRNHHGPRSRRSASWRGRRGTMSIMRRRG
ncbi:MAG TPA: hypothetical protein DCP69_02705 [Candidatus Omnitrophica bacterium]|nr:MAG: hypothetical protein A3G88_05990 [Omnitrophica WOR_2 bacterium RIFCSPLOWO2_12_FULL_63_16]HAM40260.1 hypothetical protein [Candidatus Omnitrophota bacterium]